MNSQATQTKTLETLLRPRSVAIVGAGEEPTKFNGASLHNLKTFGYSGDVYAVNPSRQTVQGITCYPTILDIPGQVDTAVVTVPARHVLGVLAQCAEKGVSSATLVSSGFAEGAAGDEGQRRAAELDELLRSTGIRVLGPNTAGMLNLFDGYVPRAAHNHLGPDRLRVGSVALVGQSGACSNTLFNRAQANGVGVSLAVATGDQADIDVWDVCDYCVTDDRITVIMLIVESFGDVAKARRVARSAVAAGKPIVMLKVGQSNVGRAVVQAHSGSIAGNAEVQAAAMRDFGLIAVRDLDELWEVARLVEGWGPPPGEPMRLGVVSVSGGEAALIADQCEANGIALPPVATEFSDFVEDTFEYASGANPFDPTGEVVSKPERLREGVAAFAGRNDFSHLLFASPVFGSELAERYFAHLREALAEVRVGTVLSVWPAGEFTARQVEMLTATGHPVLTNSVRAVRAMALYQGHGLRRAELLACADRPARDYLPATVDAPGALRYAAARETLRTLGLPFVQARECDSADAAADAAAELGGRVVLKANVPSAVHKADHGLIAFRTGADPAGVRAAYTRIVAAGQPWAVSSVVMEGFAFGQVQVILGAHRDPEFGPIVLFGSGGGPVEFLDDVQLAPAESVVAEGARRLITGSRIGRYLDAKTPDMVAEMANALEAVAVFILSNPAVGDIDINPCIVDTASNTWACADARIV